jgi:hypothetical protein
VIKEKKVKIRMGALFPLILICATEVAIAGPASKVYSATEIMVLNGSALMRWSHIVGQFSGLSKVYSVV